MRPDPRYGRRARGAVVGLIALVAAGGSATAIARPQSTGIGTLDRALSAARARVGAPGAEATVVACGRVVWAGFSGVSDVRSRRPVNGRTLFVLASSTKTITATMVMQLVQAGRLSLDTPLARFYPRVPNAANIKVRNLLDMTSGLPDYLDNPTIANIINNQPRHRWSRNEVIAAIGKPHFAPGSQYQYSNSNFILLGGIIEQLTRRSIESNFQTRIARPAGMTASTFVPNAAGTKLMAHPYTQAANGALTDWWIPGYGLSTDYWGPVWTDGGLATTATGLAKFGNALSRGVLVSLATVAEMTDVGPNDYGLGIYGQSFDGHYWLGHDGDYGGFESEDWTDRARQVSIAVTTNLTEPDSAPDTASDRIWRAVVQAYDATRPAGCAT
jgi:D-alanyl-D-alanine carboxypeptidase